MVKKINKKSSVSRKRRVRWLLSPKFLVIFVVIIGVLGYFGIRQYEIRQERNDLLAKHQKLEELADQIATVNKPDKRESTQSCHYSSRKFEKGDLSCSVQSVLAYTDVDSNRANIYMSQAKELVSSMPIFNQLNKNATSFPAVWDPQAAHFSQKLEGEGVNECAASYTRSSSQQGDDFIISLTCSMRSMSEHFQLEN